MRLSLFGSLLALRSHRYSNRKSVTRRTIFISWIASHGRSVALAEQLGTEVFFPPNQAFKRSLSIRYWCLSTWTCKLLLTTRPSAIICMQPPIPAVILCWLYCLLRPKTKLVADLHSGALNDPKWRWAQPLLRRILRGRAAIVTGSVYAQVVQNWGIKSFIIHDPLQLRELEARSLGEGGFFVCAAGWARDEPLHELVRAFHSLPYKLRITGSMRYELDAPENVVITGYLDNNAFDECLSQSFAIISLTSRDETMQRGGYEALERGKLLLTSDTRILREYFGPAAVYCTANPVSIRLGVEEVVARQEELRSHVRALQERVQVEGELSLQELRRYLND